MVVVQLGFIGRLWKHARSIMPTAARCGGRSLSTNITIGQRRLLMFLFQGRAVLTLTTLANKKERNADLTMLGMVDANNTLRRELRGPHRETTGQIPEVPAIDVRPETQTHASNNMAHEIDSDNERQIGKQGTERVQIFPLPIDALRRKARLSATTSRPQ